MNDQLDANSKLTIKINRLEIYFLYAIDLGYLLIKGKKGRESLQLLRATGAIRSRLVEIFNGTKAEAGPFQNPKIEDIIQDRADQIKTHRGKNIWSDLFFENQIPIRFERIEKFSDCWVKDINEQIDLPSWIRFEKCEFRIFKEGVLVVSYKFSRNETNLDNLTLPVEKVIGDLKVLETITFDSFRIRIIKSIVRTWTSESHLFQQILKLSLRDPKTLDNTLLRSTVKHSCILLENLNGLHNKTSETFDSESLDEATQRLLLGILNRTNWYTKYSKRYITETFMKNVGYRKDEIYLTDKNSTLILLEEYWKSGNPIRWYMEDLILAIQLQIAKQAYLEFFLRYMQSNSYSQKILGDLSSDDAGKSSDDVVKSSDDAVKLVLQARNILILLQESTDINSLIIHGFTRKFLEKLVIELKMENYLTLIKSRIANIDDAVQLKSARDIGKQSIILDKWNVQITRYGLVIAIVALFIEIMTLIPSWLQWFMK